MGVWRNVKRCPKCECSFMKHSGEFHNGIKEQPNFPFEPLYIKYTWCGYPLSTCPVMSFPLSAASRGQHDSRASYPAASRLPCANPGVGSSWKGVSLAVLPQLCSTPVLVEQCGEHRLADTLGWFSCVSFLTYVSLCSHARVSTCSGEAIAWSDLPQQHQPSLSAARSYCGVGSVSVQVTLQYNAWN